ncbi:MAG: DUF4260 domain-containing protein [Brachymonas sp.]
MNAPVTGALRWILRLEALALLVISAWAYSRWGGSWTQFALYFLLPDVALLGYLVNPRVGALAYNLTHSSLGAFAALAWGVLATQPLALSIALIWFVHIGFDRAMGYGLKYSAGFGFTHLGVLRLGRD